MSVCSKPHFLYNAFNTISAIALSDGMAASELIDDLGVYLRGSFQSSERQRLVTLAQEMDLVRAYLNIEKARFGERLAIDERIDAPTHCMIPSLIIQPLVENAVRHGSLGSYRRLTVSVCARVEKEELIIQVRDDGAGMDISKTDPLSEHAKAHGGFGIGLSNINQRLKLRFNRELTLTSGPGMGTSVEIRIPAIQS